MLVGAVTQLDFVWLVADTLNAFMAFPNLVSLVLLSPVVVKVTNDYFAARPRDYPRRRQPPVAIPAMMRAIARISESDYRALHSKAMPGEGGVTRRRRSNRPGNSQVPGPARPQHSGKRPERAHRRSKPGIRAKLSGSSHGGGRAARAARVSECEMTQIAVIGAGVTGLTTAYELLDRGFDVTVFDRHRYAAMETSFANGGQLSASNAEVWTQWGTVLKGLKWMLSADAPLLVNPAPTLHKMRWMAEFLSNIPNYRRNTVETVRLAIAARAVLFEMAAREGIDFDLEQRGILHFYDRQKDLAHARMVNGLLAEGGLVRRELSPAEIREVEPALVGDFVGGFLTESDSSGDIHKFTMGLARACARRGADLRFGTEIDGVEAVDGGVRIVCGGREEAFDGVVVSAGIRSRDLARHSATGSTSTRSRATRSPWRSTTPTARPPRPGSACSTTGRRSSPAASAPTASASPAPPSSTAPTATSAPTASGRWSNGASGTSPASSTEQVTPWAGLRPMMPSMLPRVGRGKQPGVFYNTGHGHLGWTLSAATARIVAGSVAAELKPQRSFVPTLVAAAA